MNGGAIIAEVLNRHGVEFLFTLCGGHISPILVESKRRGIRVIDTRHEVTAVFAADACARLTGVPGVAAVTAGPGVTNTITAVKNAQMAQSPLVLLGGATARILAGRGALQDIDQVGLLRSCVKKTIQARRVADLPDAAEEAFRVAQSDVPGPVFLECPVDVLYDESMVRQWFESKSSAPKGIRARLLDYWIRRYLSRIYSDLDRIEVRDTVARTELMPKEASVRSAAAALQKSKRPVLIAGAQVVWPPRHSEIAIAAIERLGIPTYLASAARGLLGADHDLQLRHNRRKALREADLVILAGVPNDFRLDYGRQIRGSTTIVAANRSPRDLTLNRRPDVGAVCDPAMFLDRLSRSADPSSGGRAAWLMGLRERDAERESEIDRMAEEETDAINPLGLLREIDSLLAEDSTLIADGGDFVASAAYTLSPRRPLGWLDPGPFGTLGVGAGFALASKLVRPDSEVWVLYGDGSVGLSIAEFDTFVRHDVPVIAVVGNDGCWSQIAREQVVMLEDDVGCMLGRSGYHEVASGFGAKGLLLDDPARLGAVVREARDAAAAGSPVLLNVHIGSTDFRKGSISM